MNARGDAMIESTCASESEAYGQYCSVMKISRVKKPTAWNELSHQGSEIKAE
jgi:hypothetical protein